VHGCIAVFFCERLSAIAVNTPGRMMKIMTKVNYSRESVASKASAVLGLRVPCSGSWWALHTAQYEHCGACNSAERAEMQDMAK
jgi:hypothetical protein